MSSKIDLTREQLEQWCGALLSREYEQGKGHLRLHDRHCCLGVLAEECGAINDSDEADFGRGELKSVLPDGAPVTNWGPEINVAGCITGAAFHNDAGVSFEEIAQALWEQCECVDDEEVES